MQGSHRHHRPMPLTTACHPIRTLNALHDGYAAVVRDAITTNAALGGESREELARYYLQPGPEGLQLYWNEAGQQLDRHPHVTTLEALLDALLDSLDRHPHVTTWTAYLSSALCSALKHQATAYDADGLDISANDCRWLASCVWSGRLVLMNNEEAAEYRAGY